MRSNEQHDNNHGSRLSRDCGGGDDDLFGGDSDGQCPYCPNMVVLKVTRRFRGSGRCV
ncbi:hypothetical protein Ancab_006010 [Ancistrocladus abbreviatus]